MHDLFPAATIKALSLWQPWASLMAAGVKRHETRGWSTPYRGPLAIHAAKTLDEAGAPEDLCIAVFGRHWRAAMPLGAVVAIGDLRGCLPAAEVAPRTTRADREAGNFTPGRWAWRIDDVRPLAEPIALAGRQALFNWTPPAALLLPAAVDHEAQCRLIGWL
jgi:activating signal cointegrator 1